MIDEKRPGMLQTTTLHHGNAPSHRAAQTTETIKILGIELLGHPVTQQTLPLVIFSNFIDQESFERYVI